VLAHHVNALPSTLLCSKTLIGQRSSVVFQQNRPTGAGRRRYARLVAKRSRERLRDSPTMVKKLFVRNGTESLPETAMDTGRQNDYK
jgi:hypothetical protein